MAELGPRASVPGLPDSPVSPGTSGGRDGNKDSAGGQGTSRQAGTGEGGGDVRPGGRAEGGHGPGTARQGRRKNIQNPRSLARSGQKPLLQSRTEIIIFSMGIFGMCVFVHFDTGSEEAGSHGQARRTFTPDSGRGPEGVRALTGTCFTLCPRRQLSRPAQPSPAQRDVTTENPNGRDLMADSTGPAPATSPRRGHWGQADAGSLPGSTAFCARGLGQVL